MAWGKPSPVGMGVSSSGNGNEETSSSVVSLIEKNDPNVHSITVFRGRHFNGAKEITAVGNALEKNAFIKEFYSSGHEVDEESAKILGKSFLKMKSLESICVGDERFGDESDDAFAVFVSYAKELDGLRRWDLENKGLTKRSFGKVSDAFQSGKFKRLEELILNRNGSLSDGIRSKKKMKSVA